MPTCIYCTEPTSIDEPKAHVFPEVLAQNDLLLPPGAECGKCNRYFGHELDDSLIHFPWIAFCIQFLGLPGKAGKARKKLGRVERHPDGTITVEVERPVLKTGGGQTEAHVTIGPDKYFNVIKFRRALHHIAFNIMAKERGIEHALKAHFDPVRNYVRRPRSGEAWPFVQIVEDISQIRPAVQGRLVPEAPGDTVCVRIFNCDSSFGPARHSTIRLHTLMGIGNQLSVTRREDGIVLV